MLIFIIYNLSSTKSDNKEKEDHPEVEDHPGEEDNADGDVDYPEVDEGLAK